VGNKFASDNKAIAECDICGFRYKLRTLRYLIVKTKTTNIKACNECWSPDQPQLQQGMYPDDDPQAIRNPIPDFTGYPQSRSQVMQVIGMTTTSFVGQVTIS